VPTATDDDRIERPASTLHSARQQIAAGLFFCYMQQGNPTDELQEAAVEIMKSNP